MAITPFTVDDEVIDIRMNQMVNEVSSAIGQIADDRGYIDSKSVTDLNLAVKNGKYRCYAAPNAPVLGGQTFLIDVNTEATIVSQLAICVFGSVLGKSYTRTRLNDGVTWTIWKEIATTESYELQVSDMRTGFALDTTQMNIVTKTGKGNILQVSVNTPVAVSIFTTFLQLPLTYTQYKPRQLGVVLSDGTTAQVFIATNGTVQISRLPVGVAAHLSIPYGGQ